jgi:uracil-DNA glycosylase
MSTQKRINIPDDWYSKLKDTVESKEFTNIATTLKLARSKRTIYPKSDEVFKAFQLTPFGNIRVVILGMD